MGCDIHWFVETRDDEGIWHAAEMPRAYLEQVNDGWWAKYYDDNPAGDDLEYNEYRVVQWNVGRNYRLFDALNGVRCRGLSTGITEGRFWYSQGDTDDHPHDIIGELRDGPNLDEFGHHVNWPFNTSDRVLHQMWDGDGHSYCWGYLKDLQDERIAQQGGDGYIRLMKFMQELNEDPTKVRALWFYDN